MNWPHRPSNSKDTFVSYDSPSGQQRQPDWARKLLAEEGVEVGFVEVAVVVDAGPQLAGGLVAIGVVGLIAGLAGLVRWVDGSPWRGGLWLLVLCASLAFGFCSVRRIVGRHWLHAVGVRPTSNMLLILTADRLLIWRYRVRRKPRLTLLLDLPRDQLAAREKYGAFHFALILPNGASVLLEHQLPDRPTVEQLIRSLNPNDTSGQVDTTDPWSRPPQEGQVRFNTLRTFEGAMTWLLTVMLVSMVVFVLGAIALGLLF